jgi:hypothetical protein
LLTSAQASGEQHYEYANRVVIFGDIGLRHRELAFKGGIPGYRFIP